MSNAETVRADPELRRKYAVAAAGIVVFKAMFVYWLPFYLNEADATVEVLVGRVVNVIYILALSVLPALYLLWRLFKLGRAAVAKQRFPPHDTKMIRDTVVVKDKQARQRGYFLRVLSLLIAAVFISIPIILYVFLSLFVEI